MKTSHTLWIGAHTSAAGGVHNALYEGKTIGATTIQLFTSNQRQWRPRPIDEDEIDLWKTALHETQIGKVMSHAGYLINLGSSHAATLHKSRTAFKEELERCHSLNIPYLNFHPGAATGATEDQCIETIVESLLEIEELAKSGPTRLLIETMAGQGSCVGYRFEHLASILQGVHKKVPIGICIDTCHIFAAGYDIRTATGWDQVLKEFDQIIGLHTLHAFHLNDSIKELGSRVDRHAPLGKGEIGLECFRFLMTDPRTKELPKYLETPEGPPLWKKEICLLKEFAHHAHED